MPICIYPSDCTDFSTNGLSVLTPVSCIVTEEEGGMYELEVVQPIDHTNRWAQLINGAIIKAPVPVRESPLYSVPEPEKPAQPAQPAQPQTVERNVWEVSGTTVGEYMRDGPGTGYKTHGWLVNGERVTEIGQQTVGSRVWLHVIVQKNGRDCWMSTKWLKKVSTVTETLDGQQVAPPTSTTERSVTPRQSREQLFRIYSVERDTREQTVTAHAMHIFYDLRANLVQLEPEKAALEADEKKKQDILDVKRPANTTLSSIWNNLAVKDHGFNLHVDESLTAEIQGDYSWKNPIECMLDPDEGILTQAKARLVRDNYDIYVIPDGVRDTGVTIRRGKNLKGVTVTEDAADITTRIIPCGKDGDGKDLFLDGDTNYVDSPLIANYPMPFARKIDYDVRVIKDPKKDDPPDGITTFRDAASARAKLKELAQKDFEENGVDLPVYGMEVDFVLLQNSPDSGEDYADLQAVFLGDTVTVIDSIIKLTAKIRVTAFEWDALTLQYTKVTLGQVDSLDQTIYSYNLPSGGISGSKIAPGSMSGNVLRDLTVQYAKFDQATIDQLIAQSLTAVEANIEDLIAGHITADSITSGLIEAMTAIIENLKVGNLEADDLTAKFAQFGVLLAGTAEFDRETVQHLVAEALHLSFGEADSVFIQNLMVTYAQFAAATIGDLIIKASDGKYYSLDVDPETGLVTATQNDEVTEGDILSGHHGGQTIIDTNILAENLSTKNLFATYALINQIDAARIDVDQLFAREAFLDLLWTTQIHGDESIEMWVHNSLRKVVTEYYVSESPSIPTGGEWSETFPGSVTSDKYLWRHIKSYKGNGEYEYTSEECLTLSQGAQGPAGVGIESIEEFYGLSASADIQPTEWQSEPMPPTPDNRWLWNKEVIHYDNQTTQDGEPHIIGVFGQDGKIGRGIKEVKNYYLASSESSGVTRETEGWTEEMQLTTTELRYLWNYEEIVWSDGSESSYTSPIIIGTHGATGDPGPQGPAGANGIEGPQGTQGINLILNSNFSDGATHWSKIGAPTKAEIVEQDGRHWAHIVGDSTVQNASQAYQQFVDIEPSTTYTVSFKAKTASDGQAVCVGLRYGEGGSANTFVSNVVKSFALGAEEQLITFSHTAPAKAKTVGVIIGARFYDGWPGGDEADIYYTNVKLEAGAVANPTWTPAPQDLKGADGKSNYFHIKYATKLQENGVPNPEDMTEEAATFIGTYVDFTEADSNDPFDYKWQRLEGAQGADGKQGIKGEDGVNGLTSYLHIKYSNDGGKTFTGNEGEEPGDWIGQYVDYEEPDSTDPKKYKWAKIKGEQGLQGLQGLQGERGEDGIPGVPGKDGSDGSSVNLLLNSNFSDGATHWSKVGAPTKAEIVEQDGRHWAHIVGDSTVQNASQAYQQFVDIEPSTTYTVSFKAKAASDGQAVFVALRYGEGGSANTFVSNVVKSFALGAEEQLITFSHTAPAKAKTVSVIIGARFDDNWPGGDEADIYYTNVKLEAGAVTNPVWTPNPMDNATYFHIKYSAKETPTTAADMTETPDVYIGTYVDNVKADSTDPKSYQWYRFQGLQGEKGEQGIPGVGQDGKTYYLHIKYSNDGGKTFTTNNGEDSGSWIGVCTDTNEADPADVSKYKWSGIKGEQGSSSVNLILNSNFANGTSNWSDWGDPPTREIVEQNGKHWAHIVSDGQPFEGYQQNHFKDGITITGGQKYTFSAKMKGGSADQKINAGIHWKDGTGSNLSQQWQTFTVGTDEQLVSVTWTAHAGANSFNIMVGGYTSGVTDAYFTDLKLEPGEVKDPTWTPAPQDISYTPIQQYYLSTSATTQTGGSWTETQPTWESGKYLWERLRMVWSDGRADTYTTPQRALALEQALQNAQNAQDTAQNAQDLANQVYTVMDRYMTLTDDKGWEFHANLIDPSTGEEVPSIWVSRIDERGFYVQRNDIGQYVFAACRDRCLVSNLEIGKINYAPLSNSNTEAETRSSIIIKPTSTGGIVFTAK